VSRHSFLSLSGIIARLFAFAARTIPTRSRFFPVAVFAFGMVELFGARNSVTRMRQIAEGQHARDTVDRKKA